MKFKMLIPQKTHYLLTYYNSINMDKHEGDTGCGDGCVFVSLDNSEVFDWLNSIVLCWIFVCGKHIVTGVKIVSTDSVHFKNLAIISKTKNYLLRQFEK